MPRPSSGFGSGSGAGSGASPGSGSGDIRFDGMIAGFGTESGLRVVLGLWTASPYGRVADAMLQTTDGRRTLIAPASVASFIATTYTFDEVITAPSRWSARAGAVEARIGDLDVSFGIGARSVLGLLLGLQPARLAVHPRWLGLIDPLARLLVPGAATAGSAGAGRREFYGVRAARRIQNVSARRAGADLGGMQPLAPPVTFGFASLPATPHVVRVTTTIR